jgi:uncharacterized membrane protein YraQ (UPF0718 family)
MFDQLLFIIKFIADSFLHIWPYLLITIPIAVAVQLSGAAKHINRAFQARPMVAIVLATIVGAFSPFCSCGVIPIVAALLGGVPLAPVMAFWIASPSMDPEIFFLSVGVIGWQLAVWRLAATLVLSLSAGFVTHLIVQKGWIGGKILRENYSTSTRSRWTFIRLGWRRLQDWLRARPIFNLLSTPIRPFAITGSGVLSAGATGRRIEESADTHDSESASCGDSCGTGRGDINDRGTQNQAKAPCTASSCSVEAKPVEELDQVPFGRRLVEETYKAASMVVKFMVLAFFLEALITLYVPTEWITGLLGPGNPLAIITAAVMGVPVYTSNLAALPMIGGLLGQGMDPAAALAFLIAGPTTTLPAMAAVWGLATRRVFILYVSMSLIGAVLLGYLYRLIMQ